MTKKSLHVIPMGGGWVIKKEGAKRAYLIFGKKTDAVKCGKQLSKAAKSTLYIHYKNGMVQSKKDFRQVKTRKSFCEIMRVIPAGTKWGVGRSGDRKNISIFDSKPDAVKYATGIAKSDNTVLHVRHKNGTLTTKKKINK